MEQQTATSEILRVISSSPTDVQPVFDTIAQSARRLCEAQFCHLFQFDGELLHFAAHHGLTTEGVDAVRQGYPMAPGRGSAAARCVLSGAVEHIPDVHADLEYRHGAIAKVVTSRSNLAVPMLRDGVPIGAVVVARSQAGLFPDKQIELLKIFADQAVIAVENVRLFRELEARNRDLTEALEQQTATGEILRVISSSPTDVQPVFAAIAQSAMRLCAANFCNVARYDGELLHLAAQAHVTAEAVEAMGRIFPMPPSRATVVGRTVLQSAVVHLPDVQADTEYAQPLGAAFRGRSALGVPMLRDGQPVGSIVVGRFEARAFTDKQIALLQTFADQAVIAIENVRLFNELADKSRQLEVASQHKSEFLANMSHELRTPLNAVIGFSEVLTERMFGELNAKQDEYVRDIYASGTHLLSLINDILDLSKVEAGRMELELAHFHLPQAIENAVVLVRERALRRGLTLEQSIDPRLGEVQGDERKIKQVLLNLLSNAIKFTPEGGRVGVRAEPVDEHVEVAVSDTGVGIAPEDQEAVFEEFRQVGVAEKKAEGTGLGLALARKFIELHGGRIWVKSQVGAGSTFTFTIPVRRGE